MIYFLFSTCLIVCLILYFRVNRLENLVMEPKQRLGEKEKQDRVDIVLTAIEDVFGLSRHDDKFESSQEAVYLDARKIFFFNLYPHYGSMTEIGNILGKNHPAVINALRRYSEHYSSDKEFRKKADMVKVLIKKQLNEAK